MDGLPVNVPDYYLSASPSFTLKTQAMKTLLLSFLLACFFITAQAQYSDSSAISPCVYLQYSFEVHFGTIEKVQWHRTINELFRADFTRNGIGYSAYFDSN